MEKFMNIKKNKLFKRDFDYPLFSRVSFYSDTTFCFVLEQRTFLFNKKRLAHCNGTSQVHKKFSDTRKSFMYSNYTKKMKKCK